MGRGVDRRIFGSVDSAFGSGNLDICQHEGVSPPLGRLLFSSSAVKMPFLMMPGYSAAAVD